MDKIKKTIPKSDNLQIYADAFDQMPGLVYLIDSNCVLIGCNQNLLKLLQVKSINTEKVGEIYHLLAEKGIWTEEQVQLFKQNDIDTILSTIANTDAALPVFSEDNQISYYQPTRIPILKKSGEVSALLIILTDVTSQKKMGEQFEAIKKELSVYNSQDNKPRHQETKPNHEEKPIRVLLIEDNLTAQQAAKSILMNCDCLVDVVDNEAQFNQLFKPGKYDLVFMDIGLENTSGYAFAKQLRKKEQGSKHKAPIIALTGFDPDLVSLDCGYYQMEGAIGKPLKLEQAKQIIQRYIHNIDIEVTGLIRG